MELELAQDFHQSQTMLENRFISHARAFATFQLVCEAWFPQYTFFQSERYGTETVIREMDQNQGQ
jgi:hypothetical protein